MKGARWRLQLRCADTAGSRNAHGGAQHSWHVTLRDPREGAPVRGHKIPAATSETQYVCTVTPRLPGLLGLEEGAVLILWVEVRHRRII